MHPKIDDFLCAKALEEIKNEEEKKNSLLIELGLYEKAYVPDDEQDDEYTYCEYDEANSVNRYFKKVPIEVTDEEYEQIKKYAMQTEKNESKHKNTIATILSVMAWIAYIAGFILGIVLGNDFYNDSFIMLIYWISGFVVGTIYLGFAEVIKLLSEIKNK